MNRGRGVRVPQTHLLSGPVGGEPDANMQVLHGLDARASRPQPMSMATIAAVDPPQASAGSRDELRSAARLSRDEFLPPILGSGDRRRLPRTPRDGPRRAES